MSKKKNNAWFRKVRGSYLPNNLYGALTYIPFIGLSIYVIYFVVHTKPSIAQGFIDLFCFFIAEAVFMTWFASNHSK